MKQIKQAEGGNVLFLILIAVALFAALSYAVTQSTRGGGEGATEETALINSAQITQYPATVRTAIIRMVIRGADFEAFEFNPPSLFTNCTSEELCVFHPRGGGATYVEAPGSIMQDGQPGTWYFNANFEIVDIGLSEASNINGNDLLAFLPGISRTLCERINDEFSIDFSVEANITLASDLEATYTENMDDTYSIPSSEDILGDTNTESLRGQPYGCFVNGGGGGERVYYHVLLEQ